MAGLDPHWHLAFFFLFFIFFFFFFPSGQQKSHGMTSAHASVHNRYLYESCLFLFSLFS